MVAQLYTNNRTRGGEWVKPSWFSCGDTSSCTHIMSNIKQGSTLSVAPLCIGQILRIQNAMPIISIVCVCSTVEEAKLLQYVYPYRLYLKSKTGRHNALVKGNLVVAQMHPCVQTFFIYKSKYLSDNKQYQICLVMSRNRVIIVTFNINIKLTSTSIIKPYLCVLIEI